MASTSSPLGSRRATWAALIVTGFVAGALFGPSIATAASKVSDVFVTNTATDPVPVAGTVNVGNLPATQPVSGTVNVGNLPATQPVSGTVNVGSVPAVPLINEGITQSGTTQPGQTDTVQVFGNITAANFTSSDLASLILGGNNVGNGYRLTVSSGGQSIAQSFYNPLPITSVSVRCDPSNASACRWVFAVAGI